MSGGTFDGFPHSRSITRPQATGFALQNRTNTKKDTLLRVFFRVGTPDWIRTSGLQSRSYQAVKPESPAAQGLGWCCTNFRHFEENLGSLIGQGFRGFSQ